MDFKYTIQQLFYVFFGYFVIEIRICDITSQGATKEFIKRRNREKQIEYLI